MTALAGLKGEPNPGDLAGYEADHKVLDRGLTDDHKRTEALPHLGIQAHGEPHLGPAASWRFPLPHRVVSFAYVREVHDNRLRHSRVEPFMLNAIEEKRQ